MHPLLARFDIDTATTPSLYSPTRTRSRRVRRMPRSRHVHLVFAGRPCPTPQCTQAWCKSSSPAPAWCRTKLTYLRRLHWLMRPLGCHTGLPCLCLLYDFLCLKLQASYLQRLCAIAASRAVPRTDAMPEVAKSSPNHFVVCLPCRTLYETSERGQVALRTH